MTTTNIQNQAIEIIKNRIEEVKSSDAYTAFTRFWTLSNLEQKLEKVQNDKYYAENFLKNNA